MTYRHPGTWDDVRLALAQLAAVDLWLEEARTSATDPATLDRQRHALTARVHEQLLVADAPLRSSLPPRLVLAHRDDAFVEKLEHTVKGTGMVLVSHVRDADAALGCVVAEQPDVLLAENDLPGATRQRLLQDVLRYSPHCAVGVQVQDDDPIGRLLDAGAAYVWHRQVPPEEVAEQLVQLVTPDVPLQGRVQALRSPAAVAATASANYRP